jgi:3-deoxy-D-manno-octulosonic-acid transferase
MNTKQEFLIIRLSAIGDVLHCTPVARELKKARPDCLITWLAGEFTAELLAANPYIDEVLVWPKERWEKAMRAGNFGEAWQLWQKVRQMMSGRSFAAVLDIHGLFFSGAIARMPKATERIGMKQARELNPWFMSKTIAGPTHCRHLIFRYLSVLKGLGIDSDNFQMDLFLPERAKTFAANFLQNSGLNGRLPILAVVPGTTWEGKNWPPEYFAQIITSLAGRCQVVLCGGPGERKLADEIMRQVKLPVADAVGKTSLLELGAILARSALVLTGDTGPLHMAVALNIPTVSLFGASDPLVYGPLEEKHIVLKASAECAPCNKRKCPRGSITCMPGIKPDTVLRAIDRML